MLQAPRRQLPQTVGKALELFPSTRSQPLSFPRLSVHQRAEQGARFLRIYHPDVDVSFELIKDQLHSDEQEAGAFVPNPYVGNSLAQSALESKQKKVIHFLAFPCGETGSDLNVSSFYEVRREVVFGPSAAPVTSFDTPIQQVIAFPPGPDGHRDFSLVAVRTHATVSIVKLQDRSPVQWERPSLTATVITPVSISDTGSRRVVDVSGAIFSSSNAQALLVNNIGSVYSCRLAGEEKTMVIAPNPWEADIPEPFQFWRVSWRDLNTGLRSSSKQVQLFDLRAGTTPALLLFDLKVQREFLTSIEAPLEGRQMMCLSTTNKLVWIDERNNKGPLLSVKHQRAFDRTLRVETVLCGNLPLTTLSSSANSLVTVYDVDYDSSGYVHMHGGPSILPGPPLIDLPLAGSVFFRHTANKGPSFDMIQLSHRGSLWKTKIRLSNDTDDAASQDASEGVMWTADVHALKAKVDTMSETIPPYGGREYLNANIRGCYEKIFQVHRTGSENAEPNNEDVYQTLERMPFFWKDMDEPAEHMFLIFDVAFRCGTEPVHASRADFLTESLLSSFQGFVALTGERVPIARLVSTVRWHYDLKLLPSFMVPNIATRSQSLIDNQREEALAHSITAEGMKRAIEATQHLALDLALSRYVCAPQSFSNQHTSSNKELDYASLLSQATQAMSLSANEPVPVYFGFLRPVIRVPYEQDEQMESADESNEGDLALPLGVRLLLSNWEVGTDPQRYVYKNPYGESDPSLKKPAAAASGLVNHLSGGQNQRQATAPLVTTVRAPPIVTSTSRPLLTGPPASVNATGPEHLSDTFSSDIISRHNVSAPSTQILHSQELGSTVGRLQKNRLGKKRMGGF